MSRFLGPLWMIVFCLFLPLGDSLTRVLRESGLHVTQVIFLEYVVITLALLPFVRSFGSAGLTRPSIFRWHALRCITFLGAALVWVGVLPLVPLTQLFAIGFLAPIFASVLSVILLREKLSLEKVLCLVFGLIGTLIIIRPGFTQLSPYLLIALLSPFFWAFTMVSTKRLTSEVSASMMLFVMAASTMVLSFPPALMHWGPVPTEMTVIILSIAAIGILIHFSIIKAYQHSDITVLAPLEFSSLIFATLFSVFFFNETLEIWTYLGALFIIASNLYVTLKAAKSNSTNK